jgi:ribonuclease P protein component
VLSAQHRLRDGRDFTAAVRSPRSVRTGNRRMVVHVNPADTREGQSPRVGFVVSKAVGNAVVRTRTKRVLRALMRERLVVLPSGLDVVVRANPAAAGVDSATLGADLDRLLPAALHKLATRARERT